MKENHLTRQVTWSFRSADGADGVTENSRCPFSLLLQSHGVMQQGYMGISGLTIFLV